MRVIPSGRVPTAAEWPLAVLQSCGVRLGQSLHCALPALAYKVYRTAAPTPCILATSIITRPTVRVINRIRYHSQQWYDKEWNIHSRTIIRDLVIFLMTTGKISSVSRVGVVSHSHSHPLALYNSLILSQRNRITHLNISLINNSRMSVAFIVHGSITFGIFLLLRMVCKRILEVGLEEHSKSWVISYGPQDLCICYRTEPKTICWSWRQTVDIDPIVRTANSDGFGKMN